MEVLSGFIILKMNPHSIRERWTQICSDYQQAQITMLQQLSPDLLYRQVYPQPTPVFQDGPHPLKMLVW
jgi:hypothetical protein